MTVEQLAAGLAQLVEQGKGDAPVIFITDQGPPRFVQGMFQGFSVASGGTVVALTPHRMESVGGLI